MQYEFQYIYDEVSAFIASILTIILDVLFSEELLCFDSLFKHWLLMRIKQVTTCIMDDIDLNYFTANQCRIFET